MYCIQYLSRVLDVIRFRDRQDPESDVFDDWVKAYDEGYQVDTIYLDFKKAFDSVPHGRLLTKLKGYGFDGKLLKWIEDFLSERRQQVILNGEESEWIPVTPGIPQGSVLGPVLFIIYINDMPDTIRSMCGIVQQVRRTHALIY